MNGEDCVALSGRGAMRALDPGRRPLRWPCPGLSSFGPSARGACSQVYRQCAVQKGTGGYRQNSFALWKPCVAYMETRGKMVKRNVWRDAKHRTPEACAPLFLGLALSNKMFSTKRKRFGFCGKDLEPWLHSPLFSSFAFQPGANDEKKQVSFDDYPGWRLLHSLTPGESISIKAVAMR